MIIFLKNIWKISDEAYIKLVKIPRFIISGGTATVVNLGVLFLFTHFFKVWYLISASIAVLSSFFVSFLLQKFWTFRDISREGMAKQVSKFFVVAVVGLLINTMLMYFFVEFINIHYLLAQFINGIIIAFINFYIYQKFIFYEYVD